MKNNKRFLKELIRVLDLYENNNHLNEDCGENRIENYETTNYPSLYQINTRVWLTELSSKLGTTSNLG